MYRVAICEDEAVFANTQEKICRNILKKLNIESSITVFHSSEDLLSAFSHRNERYDLFLLDIIMGGMDGMELAKTIRQSDKEAAIIFLTSSRDHTLQGYDVAALHYLIKPADSDLLERLIKTDYKRRFQNQFLHFVSGDKKIRVLLKDIICMETVGRRVEVTLANQTVYYPGKLSELVQGLPKNQFVRCHQSFVINISNIQELTVRDAVAFNGKVIPVSRTFAKDVKRAFVGQLKGRRVRW